MPLAPAPSVDHQTLAFEVGHQIRTALEGHGCRVLMAPVDVLLSRADETDDAVDTVAGEALGDSRRTSSAGIAAAQ